MNTLKPELMTAAERLDEIGRILARGLIRLRARQSTQVLSQPKNRGVGLFPAHVPYILNPLGSGEQIGIDRRGADRAPDLPHGFAHRIQESAAGILHQVPAVGDLDGLRQRLCRRRGISCEAHSMVRSGCGFWYDSFSPLAAAQFFLPRR